MKLHIKMVISMVCLLAVLFSMGSSILISSSFQQSLEREKGAIQEMSEMLVETQQAISEVEKWSEIQDLIAGLERLSAKNTTYQIVLIENSRLIYSNTKDTPIFHEPSGDEIENTTMIEYYENENSSPCLQATTSILFNEKELYLIVGRDLTDIYEVREQQIRTYRGVFIVLIFICIIICYFIARSMTKPLAKLTKVTREIASGNYSYRSKVKSTDEIGELSLDFNQMASQVEDSIYELKEQSKKQELFMGAFAHELKTPMTSVIGYADMIRRQTLTEEELVDAADYIFNEGKRLERLSLKLLDIFMLDKQKLVMQPCNMKIIVNEVVEHFYANQGIKITCNCDSAIWAIDPDLFKTLLINLLDNARKALPEQGKISIKGVSLEEGYSLSIRDNGGGMEKSKIPHIKEPFYRIDKARSRSQGGAGLGLTLCYKIVELHNGTLTVASKIGTGTKVKILLQKGGVADED